MTTALASFISLTPVSPSTTKVFTVSVAASTDTSLATNSPYIITVKAALTASLTKFITDTLTLTVKNSCVTPIVATALVKNYDWVLLTGDKSVSYDVTSLFNCPGEPVSPSFSIVALPPLLFQDTTADKIVSWGSSSFTTDAVYTLTVTATLQSPHTQTVT